ncbi:MAG TPA: PfkB family carbohydrate kinase [Devosiaceae bacterium]|jgi:sugar/nucleoside kinase (ribokinase family)
MSTIIVAGNVNHDRIWRLDGPLRAGDRLTYETMEVRLGGGGYSTGSMLRELGHEVAIVCVLMDDEPGRAALETLVTEGFDTRYVSMAPGQTPIVEILVDSEGERTIIGQMKGGKPAPKASILRNCRADAAYINMRNLEPEMAGDIATVPLVLSHLPLNTMMQRPADIMIASRADFDGQGQAEIWGTAQAIAGKRLSSLILTDGPDPICILDSETSRLVTPTRNAGLADTTGAGDFFAGAYLSCLLNGDAPERAAGEASALTVAKLLRRQVAPEQ